MRFCSMCCEEMSVVCHYLDATSLLRLGRISKHMMRVCSAPFAWRYSDARPVVVDFNHNSLNLADRVARASLLQHAHFAVRWTRDGSLELPHDVVPAPDAAEIAALLAVPRMVSLDARLRDSIPLAQLLRHTPLLQTLQCLMIGSYDRPSCLNEESVALLPRLAALTTLSVHKGLALPNSSVFFNALASLPSLTSLQIACCFGLPCYLAAGLDRCTKLRRLHLRRLAPGVLKEAMSRPRIQHVEHLTLECSFGDEAIVSGEYLSHFAAMHAIQQLHLSGCLNLSTLLPELASCSTLRELLLQPGTDAPDVRPTRLPLRTFLLALDPLRQLLTTLTQLRVTVCIPSLDECMALPGAANGDALHWESIVALFGALDRTRVVHVLPADFVF